MIAPTSMVGGVLTRGAAGAVLTGAIATSQVDGPALRFQVLDARVLVDDDNEGDGNTILWKLALSDGEHHFAALLTGPSPGKGRRAPVPAAIGTVVELRRWQPPEMDYGQVVVVIEELVVVVGEVYELLGSPTQWPGLFIGPAPIVPSSSRSSNVESPFRSTLTAPKREPVARLGIQGKKPSLESFSNQNETAASMTPSCNLQQGKAGLGSSTLEVGTTAFVPSANGSCHQTSAPFRGQRPNCFSRIADLDSYSRNFSIRARITATTTPRDCNGRRKGGGKSRVCSVEIIDASGAECRATLFGAIVDQFHMLLATNRVIELHGCQAKKGDVRYTRHAIEIILDHKGFLALVEDDGTIPHATYNFTALACLQELPAGAHVDVAVVVSEVFAPHTFTTTKGGTRLRLHLLIVDDSGRGCKFTIWGPVDKGSDQQQFRVGCVLFIRRARVSDFGGVRSLESCEFCSIDIDPDQPRAFHLHKWYQERGKQVCLASFGAVTSRGLSSANRPRCWLAQVNRDVPATSGSFDKNTLLYRVVPVTVLAFYRDRPIFYRACTSHMEPSDYPGNGRTCNRKAERLGRSWQCSLGHTCDEPSARYVLRLKIVDVSGSLDVTAFDDEARTLLGGYAASEVAELDDQKEIGDEVSSQTLKNIFRLATYQRWAVEIRSRRSEFGGQASVKHLLCDCVRISSLPHCVEDASYRMQEVSSSLCGMTMADAGA